ncbi:MAG: Lrp/AsnC family transcriptional regulator [Rhodoglobus sp.]
MTDDTSLSLDEIDQTLLDVLQQDGRTTMTHLAQLVHLSQPAVSARVRKLELAGYITGYGARVSARRVGLSTHAVIRLRTTHSQIQAALTQFGTIQEVHRIYRVTGEDCFVLDVHTASAERLEQVIDMIGRFGPVSTALVLREYPAHPIAPAGAHPA